MGDAVIGTSGIGTDAFIKEYFSLITCGKNAALIRLAEVF